MDRKQFYNNTKVVEATQQIYYFPKITNKIMTNARPFEAETPLALLRYGILNSLR